MRVKVAVFSSTRADSGIFRPLLLELVARSEVDLLVYVSGTHLQDNARLDSISDFRLIPGDCLIALPIPGLEVNGLADSIGLGYLSFLNQLRIDSPDLALVLGDRIEALMFAFACTVENVPVAHLHGGEVSSGALDELHRHAITKLSALHFASDAQNASRIIQMGEDEHKVFHFGSPRVDSLEESSSLRLDDLTETVGVDIPRKFALVAIHPALHDSPSTLKHLESLIAALERLDIFTVFTGPNVDPGAEDLRREIVQYVRDNSRRAVFLENMGERAYLSALRLSSVAIGNSSSLVLEAPFFGTPVVLLGERQVGRTEGQVQVGADSLQIFDAIKAALASERSAPISFERPEVSRRIVDVLVSSSPVSTRKTFHERR